MQALLRLLVGTRFQVLFHSPPGVLFTFPSRYLSTIGHRRVFRVGGWSPRLPTGFHVSGSTQVPPGSPLGFAYGALTLSRRPSQAVPLPRGFVTAMWVVLQPRRRRSNRRFALGPRSLATTRGISFDFSSSGYLDVSVPRVASGAPMCSARGGGVWPPPGSPISGYVLLTVAYRSLSRPSSASCAKASTVCPYHLLLDGSVHTYTPAASRSPVRSDAIFLKKKNIVFVTLCSSQGTARASPRDRTLRALARRKASAGTDGHRLVCDNRFLWVTLVSLERR